MITVNSNISVIIRAKLAEIQELRNNPDAILRTVALSVLPEMKHRVHVEGKDSSGGAIGNYSKGYMVLRTGNYQDAAKFKRGAKKGKFKDQKVAGEAGKFSDKAVRLSNKEYGIIDDRTGQNRPVYNRENDSKVILSLTRQMENDLTVIAVGTGYGIGYLNPLNFKKAIWCEESYKKPILTKLATAEKETVKKVAQGFTAKYLKNPGLTAEQYLGL